MEYLIIGSVALLASGLTLFSGFGLGTILMPFFAIFFPLELAISLTAIVHFLNNIFKLFLLGKNADKNVLVAFGLPAIAAALAGATLLYGLQKLRPLWSYHFNGHEFQATPVKLTVAVLMIGFTVLEMKSRFQKISFERRLLPWGGLLSGFFGGISGHQGALRSLFLMKCGLSKESFIATGVVLACLVDFARISVYSRHFSSSQFQQHSSILLTAIGLAFSGAYIGNRLVKKVTLRTVQMIVSGMIIIIAVLLGAGLI